MANKGFKIDMAKKKDNHYPKENIIPKGGVLVVKNRLKEIRMQEYMLNKKEFAKAIDINYVQYIGYENGTVPYLEVALKIAKKLNRSIDEIFYLED